MKIIIKKVNGLKFALTGNRSGYAHSTGFGFFDTDTNEWIAGTRNGISTEFPYLPIGGKSACKQIMDNPGEFFNLEPRVKSIETL